MIKLTPSRDPAEIIEVLRSLADTFASVLGSIDRELLSHDGTRSGFMNIALAMSQSLTDLEHVVAGELTAGRDTARERDELAEELRRLRRRDAARDVPDLSEPAGPDWAGGSASAAG